MDSLGPAALLVFNGSIKKESEWLDKLNINWHEYVPSNHV